MMADTEYLLQFFEGGVGVFLDFGTEFLRVELAPGSPARFRRQRPLLGGHQIPINRTPGQFKPPGGLGFGAASLNEFHHPFPQVQRIGFHARKPISLCPNVNMKFYIRNLLADRQKLAHPATLKSPSKTEFPSVSAPQSEAIRIILCSIIARRGGENWSGVPRWPTVTLGFRTRAALDGLE